MSASLFLHCCRSLARWTRLLALGALALLVGFVVAQPPKLEPPVAAEHKPLLVLHGHKDRVFCVPFSPDGKQLASASTDQTIKVWDAACGKELRTLSGHTRTVYTVAFSPDGKHLASAAGGKGNDPEDKKPGELKVWELATGKTVRALNGHTGPVYSVAFSPDGKTLASGSGDETVKLWDPATGKGLRTLKGHAANVYTVAFSPDGKRLASVSGDFYAESRPADVKVWDPASGKELFNLKGHAGPVYHVTFSTDGKQLATAGNDRTIRVWDALSGHELITLTGHASQVFAVAFSPDGRRLASAGYDKSVRVWEALTGQEVLTLKGHKELVHYVTYSPDGHRLVTGSTDKTAIIWDASGLSEEERRQRANPTAGDLEVLWADLASTDGRRAFRALEALAAAPEQATKFLKDHLRPAQADELQRVAPLLADLDHDDFKMRERASEELAKLGRLAEPALRKTVQDQPSVEVRRRIEALLVKLTNQNLPPEFVQGLRAVEVLERITTPEARQLLEKLAQGTAAARLTQEAKTALDRLSKRSEKP
jgi:Tol biopolymer transport system component